MELPGRLKSLLRAAQSPPARTPEWMESAEADFVPSEGAVLTARYTNYLSKRTFTKIASVSSTRTSRKPVYYTETSGRPPKKLQENRPKSTLVYICANRFHGRSRSARRSTR